MQTTPKLQIAVLSNGFVYVGNCQVDGDRLTITDASNVRRWGTDRGMGQLAASGPQPNTKLDPTGTVTAPVTALIHLIDCNADAWTSTAAAA